MGSRIVVQLRAMVAQLHRLELAGVYSGLNIIRHTSMNHLSNYFVV